MASKLTALTEVSVPELEDLLYLAEDPAGTPTSRKVSGNRYAGLLLGALCQGRLTTESGVPVSTSDRTSQGTLYWKPCTPEGTALTTGYATFYDGTRYVLKPLTQLSLDLSTAEAGGAIDSGELYDVFLDYNAGTPALVIGPQWTDATTRATALATQGQLTVLTGDTDWTWVGTIRASGSGVTADSGGGVTTQVGGTRFVWNAHNQVERHLAVHDTTDSWTYNTGSWRQANGAAGNKVEYVCGLAGAQTTAFIHQQIHVDGVAAYGYIGVGVDSTTARSGLAGVVFTAGGNMDVPCLAEYRGAMALGYHYLSWNELGGAATTTRWGDAGESGARQSGLYATVWC